jgi:hypothetical protein
MQMGELLSAAVVCATLLERSRSGGAGGPGQVLRAVHEPLEAGALGYELAFLYDGNNRRAAAQLHRPVRAGLVRRV